MTCFSKSWLAPGILHEWTPLFLKSFNNEFIQMIRRQFFVVVYKILHFFIGATLLISRANRCKVCIGQDINKVLKMTITQ